MPQLTEAKERVRDEVIKQKSGELSQQKAAELAAKLKNAPDFERAVKAAGFEAKVTELIARDSPLPDLGGPCGRRSGVQAAGRGDERSDRDRQRQCDHQSARKEGSHARRAHHSQG